MTNAATAIEALIGPNIGPLDRFCKRLICYKPGHGTARHGAIGQSSEQVSPFDTIVAGIATPPRHAYVWAGGGSHAAPAAHSSFAVVAQPALVLNSDHAVTATGGCCGVGFVVVGEPVADKIVGACSYGAGCVSEGSAAVGWPGGGCAIGCDGRLLLE
jgi:hypothetical protein